jgi:hypothetical protein
VHVGDYDLCATTRELGSFSRVAHHDAHRFARVQQPLRDD